MLEILIAASALLIALLGFSQALIATLRAQDLTRQQTLAMEAARRTIEEMRNVNFRDVFRQYNGFVGDDLAGPGTAPGSGFAVQGLDAVTGDADGFVGEILMPAATAAPGVLREDLVWPELGCPTDLDFSGGGPDVNDHSLDYEILPVLVRIRWRSPTGPAQIQLQPILGVAL